MNILITGATSGIGYDLSKALIKKGHTVYACCHTVEELKRVSEKSEENIHYLKLDITKEKDYAILSNLDIDVLVNQAGLGVGGSLLDLEMAKMKENFEVNVFSTLNLSKFYIENRYQNQKSGKILITSSLAGYLPIPFMGSYVATKSSLILLTKVLQRELSFSSVDVSVKLILPGAYHTGFNEYMIDGIENSKYLKNMEQKWSLMRKLFLLLEKESNYSIVKKMVKAIETDSTKFVYSAPFTQRLFTRIYRIFSK